MSQLAKFVDDVAKCKQTFIDIISFSKPETFFLYFCDSFRTSEVHQINFGRCYYRSVWPSICLTHYKLNFEDCVWSTTILIHFVLSNGFYLITFPQIINELAKVLNTESRKTLNLHFPFSFIFSDGQVFFRGVQKIIHVFIVYF